MLSSSKVSDPLKKPLLAADASTNPSYGLELEDDYELIEATEVQNVVVENPKDYPAEEIFNDEIQDIAESKLDNEESWTNVCYTLEKETDLPTDKLARQYFPDDYHDYQIHFYIHGVRVNYDAIETAKTAGLYLLSTFCNAPGIFYAFGAISGTAPKDIPSEFSNWSVPVKIFSSVVAAAFSYVHIPILAKNFIPAVAGISHFVTAFPAHPVRSVIMTGLAIHGAGAQGIVGFQAFSKINKALSYANATANFLANATIRSLSLTKAVKAWDDGSLGLTIPGVLLSLGAFFPFGEKVAEAYTFIGADVPKIPAGVSMVLFPVLSSVNAITFAYQSSHLLDTLKSAKQTLELNSKSEQPIPSTTFILRSFFSKETRTSRGQYQIIEPISYVITIPLACFSSFNLARDGFYTDKGHHSIWQGYINKDSPLAIALQSFFAVGSLTTYSKLAVEGNFPPPSKKYTAQLISKHGLLAAPRVVIEKPEETDQEAVPDNPKP